MKKMPTLYLREFENHKPTIVGAHPIKGMEWVESGEGYATEKLDGSCVAVISGEFYKRYDAKQGKPIPEGAIPCQEQADTVTGHLPCWVKCDRNNPADKHFWEAYDNIAPDASFPDGTYEAIGVHFQSNPYHLPDNRLEAHGTRIITDLASRSLEDIKAYLETHYIEGIVFWKDGKPQCKIKRSDFGFEWNNNIKETKRKNTETER